MTVAEFLKQYQVSYLPTTIDQSRAKSCIRHLNESLGSMELEKIDYQSLCNYRSSRIAKFISHSTVNKEFSVLSSALKWGRSSGITNVNPAIPKTRESPRSRALTEDDIKKLAFHAEDCKAEAYIWLLFLTGQRKSSVARLKRSQIVNGMIDFHDADDPMAHRRKQRSIIPISRRIQAILDELEEKFGTTTYVIPNGENSFYTRRLDVSFDRAAKAAGLDGISPHTIRHSTATHLMNNGVSIEEVSKYIGHSNIGITQKVYLHLNPKYLDKASNVLGG